MLEGWHAVQGYDLGAQLLNFGALIAFMGVNLAAFVRYFIREGKRTVGNLVPPLIGFAICFLLWLNLSPARPRSWARSWLVVGLAFGAWKTRGFRSSLVNFDFPSDDAQHRQPSRRRTVALSSRRRHPARGGGGRQQALVNADHVGGEANLDLAGRIRPPGRFRSCWTRMAKASASRAPFISFMSSDPEAEPPVFLTVKWWDDGAVLGHRAEVVDGGVISSTAGSRRRCAVVEASGAVSGV